MDEARPIDHPIETIATLAKFDVVASAKNNVSGSWNFNHSRKENETFDVATYGTSANGIEGDPARINVVNLNWFSTLSSRMLNETHFTYSRESRPRTAVDSNLKADTGMGFGPTFRFGNPFFLQPNVDELIWRTQLKNNLSLVRGAHTMKFGGEWMHTLNDQVFRGFFTGRYLFDSVTGFLRYANPAAAGGFGPSTVGCSGGVYVTAPTPCPAGTTTSGGPLLLYLQGAGLSGPATDAAGASKISNEEFSLVRAGPVAAAPEPHAELRAALGRAAHAGDGGPEDDGVWRLPQRSRVPVGRDHPGPVDHVPAACRCGVGRQGERPVGRARQRGRVLGASEHAQSGRLGYDERSAAADALRQYRQPHGLRRADAGLARAPHARVRAGRAISAVQRRPGFSQGLQEPPRVCVQRRLRAGARAGMGRLRRFHVGRGTATSRGS